MLDWEENLFLGLKALYRRAFVRPVEQHRAAVSAALKDHRSALTLLACMLTGRNVSILETASPVLYGRDRLFLPASLCLGSTPEINASLYRARTILAALALRHQWRRNGVPLPALTAACFQELPRLEHHIQLLRDALPEDIDFWKIIGELPAAAPTQPSQNIPLANEPKAALAENPITTEVQGQGQPDVTILPGAEGDGPGADLPMHTFEKVETIEEYNGLSRKSDDADELDDHAEALSALNMTQVQRSPERPRSIYRGELILDGLGFETDDGSAGPAGIPYPEWDWKRQTYRPDWCRVQPSVITKSNPEWLARVIAANQTLVSRLKRQFHGLLNEWLRVRRQPAGTEFDLDAAIDSEVERFSGHTPSEAVYLDRRRNLHDVAALLLCDISYSTDAWLANRRVLDIISQTVFCVGEVLHEFIEQFAIAAFTSHTRRSCPFQLIKNFRDPWFATRGRLGALEPRGYTRIGPALRHAQELLLPERALRKIIILVTDGRPCDYDRYEGAYGIKDVKKAIETGRTHGIHTHAFAIEESAAQAFPQMFSHHRYDILRTQNALARTMCKLFARLLAE